MKKILISGLLAVMGLGVLTSRHVNNPVYEHVQKISARGSAEGKDNSNKESSRLIKVVVLEENPEDIMIQFGEKRKDNYVLRTREYIGRIRYLVIIDSEEKTKHELNREIKPGTTITFPPDAIEG